MKKGDWGRRRMDWVIFEAIGAAVGSIVGAGEAVVQLGT